LQEKEKGWSGAVWREDILKDYYYTCASSWMGLGNIPMVHKTAGEIHQREDLKGFQARIIRGVEDRMRDG